MQAVIQSRGKRYRIPVDQVIVYTDEGHPIAVSYVHGGLNLHTDVTADDFDRVTSALRIDPLPKDSGGKQ